jgi:hypothetical protein
MISGMYSVGAAYFLWFLSGFGALGLHRFYLGKKCSGLLWMFTGGLCFAGSVYDFFTLSDQVREANLRRILRGPQFRAGGAEFQDRRREAENWRRAEDAEVRIVGKKESLERIILKLAKEQKGILSVSGTALAADVDLDEAKKALDTLVDKGFAELRVRKSGALVYTLPEFMDGDKDLEDF